MRPFTPRPPNQAMQFNPQQQQQQGFNQNPQFPNPQTPNFNMSAPFFPPPQIGQPQNMFAAAANMLVPQQSNPQYAPANQMQNNNNNLAAALIQMAGILTGQNVNQGMQMGQTGQMGNQFTGGFQSPQMPQPQQFGGYTQNLMMGGNQAPRPGLQQPTNSTNPQWTNPGPGQFTAPVSSGVQQNVMVGQNSQPAAASFPGGNQPHMNTQQLGSSFPIRANQPSMNMQMNNPTVQNLQPFAPIIPPGSFRPGMIMPMNNLFRPQANQVPGRCHVQFQVDGKGVPSNLRLLNPGYVKNAKRYMGPSARNGGQGCQRFKKKDRPDDYSEEPKIKYPVFKYTEQEIVRWREARKKNYPTNAKKLGKGGKFTRGRRRRSKDDYEALNLRRQQLKEILAKQSELGVEVAEVPYYLIEPKERKEKERKGKERKKVKIDAPASTSKGASVKKQPTLLEKLLAPEKMRDKSRLLQIFRFMALNNFFEEPDKALKFPAVKLEGVDTDSDSEYEDEDEDEEDNTGKECEEEKDVYDEEGREPPSSRENAKAESDKVEEGEITE